MRPLSLLRFRYSLMASAPSSKYIFAPAAQGTSHQADQYTKGSLERSQLDPDPFKQFHVWFSHAQSSSVVLPEATTLSTASLPSGKVSGRLVYLKELDDRGFVIYSNWGTSRKAKDIESNPYASLTFWWQELERQVRVEGAVERLKDEESQIYYDMRLRSSRIGAWASPQTQVLESREELEKRVQEVETRFEGQERIPVPGFWGGLRIIPEMIEFWQGRESRLHDRFRYLREEQDGESGSWKIDRLSP